jgi:predicted ABC-type exoprotein transport system permease subunit
MKGQEEKKVEKEKNKTRREKLASFFFDIAKLSYAGLVLGVLMPLFSEGVKMEYLLLIFFGVIVTVVFAVVGNIILKK